jgi:hypothetical protein
LCFSAQQRVAILSARSFAQQYATNLYRACAGAASARSAQDARGRGRHPVAPNVFFIGVNNGGVWKTTDAGRTWQPIFDDQPTGSIGDRGCVRIAAECNLRRQRRRLAVAA